METSRGRLSTTEKGAGKPLLLLHGYLANKEIFVGAADALPFRRTVAIDLPGFGESFPLPSAWSVDDYADCVSEVLDGLGEADILAHSFGARIALKLAARGDARIGKMLLTGAAGLKPRRTFSYYRKVYTYKFLKHFRDPNQLDLKYGSPDYRALSPIMKESFKKIVGEDLTPLLCDVKVPVLLVFGDKDTETPPYMAERMHRGIEGSALVRFADAGHFCFLDCPARFYAVAREFFR